MATLLLALRGRLVTRTTLAALILLFSASFSVAQPGLRFDGTHHQNVFHGLFWEIYDQDNPTVLETDFAWEAWVKIAPENGSGYVISAGFGGAHAILFGFTNDGFTNYRLTGNFTYFPSGTCPDHTNWIVFGSDYVFSPDTWYHIAVASSDHVLRIFKDGQVISTTPWQGKRVSGTCPEHDYSAGWLYVGGSNHINFTGEIREIRGWEGYSPYTGNFTPQQSMSPSMNGHDSVFLARYPANRSLVIEDLSPNGYRGKKHPGVPFHLKGQ